MLLTARSYQLSQTPEPTSLSPPSPFIRWAPSWHEQRAHHRHVRKMLLIHQTGNLKVGEVVRYTVTYTPSADRVLPSPQHLHVKIKNCAAIPLRVAYIHGPYSLSVSAYPSTFTPNDKLESPPRVGVPEFEPFLKAGGSWTTRLTVPEDIRETPTTFARETHSQQKSVTWIIEIASQILFSNSASVSYELLVGRDERSLDMGFAAIAGQGHGEPGQVKDHQQGHHHERKHSDNPKGVYSKAIKLVVDDTASLWNKPELPDRQTPEGRQSRRGSRVSTDEPPSKKKKKIHVVILTHGLHSNLGADMLYMKESIDATVRHAREEKRKERRNGVSQGGKEADGNGNKGVSTAPLSGGQEDIEGDSDDDEEEVVVRGFSGNAMRTERGIQYLGKRLARYVLELTYPDQPYLPVKKSMSKTLSNAFSSSDSKTADPGIPSHDGSSVLRTDRKPGNLPYEFTSISFVGHSLGGLIQLYAIAYIQKHSPHFFEVIKPVNFVCLASPMLGLSNENPMYVKFALDFGLVGRTGRDLGLTWKPPTLSRSGWNAMVGGLGSNQKDPPEEDPGSKPLLRILPTGPAHQVLRLFRNRTLYSNVVNDGIVPLRTSCLLFLDWRGLGKVEKARRENGLIGTMASWGWAEVTGSTSSPNPFRAALNAASSDDLYASDADNKDGEEGSKVPQPSNDVTNEDDEARAAAEPKRNQMLKKGSQGSRQGSLARKTEADKTGVLDGFWNWLRPSGEHTKKDVKMFKRSQTVKVGQEDAPPDDASGSDVMSPPPPKSKGRPPATRGDSILNDPNNVMGPPKTTIFESAGDVINPPLPPQEWIIDPSTRDRTIFHDRIYHPEDIPPPPLKTKPSRSVTRSFSSDGTGSVASKDTVKTVDSSSMRVEEKIARAYHKDLSWRKVLVRLEPDAHNNMIVRRMFANAYGWPVVKHLCDTHFGDNYSARTRDEDEPAFDRAKAMETPIGEHGEEVAGQRATDPPKRTVSELREAADELGPLKKGSEGDKVKLSQSGEWDDSYFDGTTDDDDDDEEIYRGTYNPFQRFLSPPPKSKKSGKKPSEEGLNSTQSKPSDKAEIADSLTSSPPPIEGHRGIGTSASIQQTQFSFPDADSLAGVVQAPQEGNDTAPPSSSAPGGTTEVGLRKSMEKIEELGSPSSKGEEGRPTTSGVAENVARRLSSSRE
ncbi:DUF676-domain-containing protein [Aulographum hederae CBS 113979]|uniref:DUF676-domain-containing protein n=1 Tax=Aulographum hederae CBS 113979 TaxID=1176131 RepID=A0A6G1GSI5_9PEZI|nr:DUF676-domain-containing protein [Aulographum hederae CBS 113979]